MLGDLTRGRERAPGTILTDVDSGQATRNMSPDEARLGWCCAANRRTGLGMALASGRAA